AVSDDGTTVNFQLTYRDLAGGPATGAHIHLGAPWTNGPIVVHFCGTGGKPACPAEGTVEGSFTAADVQASPDNNLGAGDLASLLRAMRAGVTYVNVHNAMFPGGEIRGQVKAVHDRRGKHDDKDKDDKDNDNDRGTNNSGRN
ncbi:MAG TPA: CHRD domain-containing protein, partial [Bryobacteraceae bacterium]|nr:CHRD domain-containing protein [Bryobacteraceae bacterium]